jgi:peptidoglycan/xylan/chitin deacetylase (PgdA/CDA1 family)
MRLYRPFLPAVWIFPEAVFRIRTAEKVLCLTFDDGPDPDSTPKILDILELHSVKAMFFLKGFNVEKCPDLKELIISRGHVTGNHGYRHLSGWTTSVKKYTENVSQAAKFTSTSFFRPPYGHLSLLQYHKLAGIYKIVFWDIMPYDFAKRNSGEECLKILKKKLRPGSIVVLHDQPDSSVFDFLDEFISFALNEGYSFVTLASGKE